MKAFVGGLIAASVLCVAVGCSDSKNGGAMPSGQAGVNKAPKVMEKGRAGKKGEAAGTIPEGPPPPAPNKKP